jgi:hypothetical protein
MKKSIITVIVFLLTFNLNAFDNYEHKKLFERILKGEYQLDSIDDFNIWDDFLFMDGVYGAFNPLEIYGSGDGNVVGNGGGMSEGTFEYSFQILGRVIKDCLQDQYCLDEQHEYDLLKNIYSVHQQNMTMKNYLIFVDGEVHKSFFDEGNGRGPRTALTGSKSMLPIFINTSHLYDALGAPRWDVGKSISILVHELGHQAGNPDHRYLDKVGQKVKRFLEADKTTLESKVNDEVVRVWMRNGQNPTEQFELGVFWDGEEKNIRDEVLNNIKCPREFDLDKFSFSNLHWDHLRYDDQDGYVVPITLWMNLRCINHSKGLVAEYENLEYKILLSRGKSQKDKALSVKYFIERL